ncbi:MFS transporter [Wenzhouxiangella sediminis]|uniref:MFS transporter n=1 Tax=Wenzhouxiangella sediminis TaxID=1792836 RepID=A0A3E1K8H8_9GAMM|nr:MFS transporter [Wenzhouxiangella sediminis]RFF30402.1 MFS transporter [Wenzhouxiangella sediminis]
MPEDRRGGLPPAGRFAFLAALCSSFGQTFYIGLFGADFRAEFGLSESALGTLYGTATLISGLSMFWLGAMADRLAMRRAIVVTMAMLAVGAALVGLTPGVAGLFVGLFLLRLAGQGLAGHLAVVAAGRYAVAGRGRAVAMATYGFILGEALLPPGVAALMGWLDWREIWFCAAAGVALLALPALFGLARPLVGHVEPEAGEVGDIDTSVRSRRSLFVNGRFLRVLAVALVSPFVVTALFLHQGTLAERLDWSLAAVASGFVLFAGMQALAAFAGGRLVDRFSARALLRSYLLPLGVGVLGLGILPSQAAMWLMFAGLGLTAGVNGVVCGAVWVELFGTARLGMIRGVYAALMVVSTAIGPIVLGMAFEAGVGQFTMGVVVMAYVLVVPALLVPRVSHSSRL